MAEIKLCECGCGSLAPLAGDTNKSKGIVKGQPLRFVHGHHRRKKEPEMYMVDNKTGCWIWVIGNSDDRYGLISNQLAHRLIYEKYKGPIPYGLILDHLCKVTLCVNPDHLEPVTYAVNTQRGLSAKLNPDKVKNIREQYQSGRPVLNLAEEFEVKASCIYSVINLESWKNIE